MKNITIPAIFLFLIGSVAVYAAGDAPATFEMLKQGKDLFESNCIECHNLTWPLQKISDREGWELTLTKMANTGAVFSQEDRNKILEYLLAKSTFQKNCNLCHGLDRALEQNKEFQNWLETVRRMTGKKPGLLTDEEIHSVSGFLTAKGAEKSL